MLTCRLTIKIKDYFPKTDSIPYSNYICLFSCGEYQGQIPFLPDESKYLQHQLKNISSDIKYKVIILDFNDMTLIGMCEMSIAYKVLNRIMPNNGFIQEQQKKLIMDTKTKRKLFGTVINSGDIYLKIYAEVSLVSKNNTQQKQKNLKMKKNHPEINTPKCYIKYNFTLNKNDFSPKSSKNNNKSTMMNTGSEKHSLNLSKQEKENNANKYSNNNSINYKKENDKKNSLRNYSNYNIINNNINFFNKKSEADIYNNKKNIMDLLEQKKMMEEIVEKYNKSDMDEKIEVEEEYDDEYNNNLYINDKDGYMTEQNFSNKFIKTSNNTFKQGNNLYNINNNLINDDYNIDEDKPNQKFFYYSKNTMSPKDISKKMYIDEDNINMSKTIKGKNMKNPNPNINKNYVYSSKNKMIKMGRVYTKARINDNMKNNNISRKSNDILYQNYITNTNTNTNTNYNNYIQIDNNTYIPNINNNIINYNSNTNIINSPSLKNSFEEEQDNDYLDIDRIILDKGAELRNEFQTQIRQNQSKNNYHKTINSLSNNDYLDQNNYNLIQNNPRNINYNSRTPYVEKISKYSSTQSLNNYLTQEDVKNNCIKLIEFYSLLNLKLKKIFPKNEEIKQKLIIFKELLSSEIKKQNIIKSNLNKNNYIFNLSKNINETMNEKILSNFPKIKKIENNIYQQLFNVYSTQEELAKFSEFENYDKQTKIFLLLNLARNLVKKYGNISQIYTIKNTVNIKKKKKLKKCLQNYSITEKDVNDKDYINLENYKNEIQNRNELSEENKFKVIKEVDEDKEEENDADDEEEKIHEWNEQNDIKEIGDENRDQIIDDVDNIDENNNINDNNEIEEEKINENLDNFINLEENGKQINVENNNDKKDEDIKDRNNIINNEENNKDDMNINNDEKIGEEVNNIENNIEQNIEKNKEENREENKKENKEENNEQKIENNE